MTFGSRAWSSTGRPVFTSRIVRKALLPRVKYSRSPARSGDGAYGVPLSRFHRTASLFSRSIM